MGRPNSVILWEGDSRIDGAPIVVIASGLNKSSNVKTGDMLQTYILRSDISPTEAVKTGEDSSICGNCVHRGDKEEGRGRSCYVTVFQGPLSVWRAYKRGTIGYSGTNVRFIGRGRAVRIGSYGDPAAAPKALWGELVHDADTYTGYTHQWMNPIGADLYDLCMASADTPQDVVAANAVGFRTFRAKLEGEVPVDLGEVLCPASAAAGYKLTCIQCGACGGARKGRKSNIFIPVHGGAGVMANARKIPILTLVG